MIYIDRNKPIYEQIYQQLKAQILSGETKPGTRLSASRALAKEYGISRNSVLAAYDQLLVEGYITSRGGSGYYVEALDIPLVKTVGKTNINLFSEPNPVLPKYNFRYGNLEYNCYQSKKWRKCIIDATDELSMNSTVNYVGPEGIPELREELAEYLLRSRGVQCDANQIIITNGHQAALDILCSIFNSNEWGFALEDPGYDGCRVVFERRGFYPKPIPVESDGISISGLNSIKHTLLYVTPSHQFPMGCILPVNKRLGLIDWAIKNNCYIIEDDYDSELRYNTHPIPSLQSLDGGRHVIYLGTFSKSLSPDLRVAYLVLPKELMSKYHDIYLISNSVVPSLIQKALYNYLRSGEYENNVRSIRTFYKKKHDTILSLLDMKNINLSGTDAGLHFIMTIDTTLPQKEIIQKMLKQDIGVYPTERYWIRKQDCPSNQILIGFSSIPCDIIEAAMQKMNRIINEIAG